MVSTFKVGKIKSGIRWLRSRPRLAVNFRADGTSFSVERFPRLQVHLFQSRINSEPVWTLQMQSTLELEHDGPGCLHERTSPLPASVNSLFTSVCTTRLIKIKVYAHLRRCLGAHKATGGSGIYLQNPAFSRMITWNFTDLQVRSWPK